MDWIDGLVWLGLSWLGCGKGGGEELREGGPEVI